MEPAQDDAAGVVREVPQCGVEAARWTVVFHRKAENRFFSAIAMGHFKHVSAFAWLPETQHWLIYDVGFRRTRLIMLGDTEGAKAVLANIVTGNATVTIDVREDELPWMRLGLFCTSAVAHLIGLRSGALRPDTLYRHLVAKGGVVRDYAARAGKATDRRGSVTRHRTAASGEEFARRPADASAG